MLTRLKQHLPFPAHSFVLFCCCGCFFLLLFSFFIFAKFVACMLRAFLFAIFRYICFVFFPLSASFFSDLFCADIFFISYNFTSIFSAQFKTLQCVPTIKSLSYVILRNNASICLLQHLCDVTFASSVKSAAFIYLNK